MFDPFPDNYTWTLGANIALAMGGEIGEVDQVIRKLKDRAAAKDDDAWYEAWRELGDRLAKYARRDDDADHTISGGRKWQRAAIYYFLAERHEAPSHPRKAETYQLALDAFRRSVIGQRRGVEFVEVPYEGTTLPALFVRVPGATGPTPCMVHFDGFDVTKEIIYMQHGYDLPTKGVALLIVDHPGVGGALRLRGLPTRHDIEVPAGAAVDYLEARPEIDPRRIGIMALSLGGYYAPRAAAFEQRFACCVAWGAIWNWHESRVRREQAGGVGMSVPPFQDLWVFGAKDWDDFVEQRKRFTLEGVVEKITCPLLVVHGEYDRQIPLDFARKTVEGAVNSPRAELKVFTAEEGGDQHCQVDNVTIGTDYMHDWIADVLGAGRR